MAGGRDSDRRGSGYRALHAVAVVVVMNLMIAMPSASSDASATATGRPEGCHATNPGHPTCTVRMHYSSTTAVTGWAGVGRWRVTIYRGNKVLRFKSPATGEFYLHLMRFRAGDHVHAAALSAGTFIQVGHVSPP